MEKIVIRGPQCQHVEAGRCKRCENPMNPKLYFSQYNEPNGGIFGNIVTKKYSPADVKRIVKQIRSKIIH